MPTYLYGDSSPFPDGYDFLADLKAFVQAASRVSLLAHQADQLEENLGERAQEHLHAIEALQTFFDGLTALIADRAARSGAPGLVGPHASAILEYVDQVGVAAKKSRATHLDTDSVEVTNQIRSLRQELRDTLARYLLNDPLPTLGWALSLNLGGTSPQGQVMLTHPGELTTSFTVDVRSDETWGRPRKVGELEAGMSLQVGFKKAFLRSSLHPDVQTLDDFYFGDIEIGPDSMELHLRRKPDSPRDAFVLDLDLDEHGRSIAKVFHQDDKRGGDSGAPFTSQSEDLSKIRALAETVRRRCQPLLQRRQRLVYAQLDEHDVLERGLVRAVFERIASRLAPIAQQVSAHSPNPSELSLKIEADGGRREEIYLRKQELIDMVAELPDEAKTLFEGLAFLPRKPTIPPAVPPLAVPT